MRKKCPYCSSDLQYGIRWSQTFRRPKVFWVCHICKIIFYKETFDKIKEEENLK